MKWTRLRTSVVVPATVAALLAATVSCAPNGGGGGGGGGGSKGKTITVYVSGDVNVRDLWQKTIVAGFKQANPGYTVKITFSEHGVNDTTTLSRLAAAVKTKQNPGMDIIDSGIVTSAAQAKLVTPITTSQVPNLDKVNPSLLQTIYNRGLPYRGSSVLIAYDSRKVKTPPKTMADLMSWIKANPGKFTYNSPSSGGAGQAFAQTVLDMNMPASVSKQMTSDANYSTALEKNWDKGWKVLKGLKPSVYHHVYPNGNQAVLDLLAKGQIEMTPAWSDQSLSALATGQLPKYVKLAQITNPSFTGSPTYVGVPVNSPNKQAAYKLLNYMLQPDVQTKIVNAVQGYPGIENKYLPQSVQSKFTGLDTDHLRPGYSNKFGNDLKQQWDQKVP
jgi:putative spermidine/putrescine transport system substrate-binding protein